ncbi:MAG TPA: hypothetical protein VMM92_07275 [Thermoanaerobaculia bacterium]|nr:hypothetical protein [Thermoanaerobaculia bacterium]
MVKKPEVKATAAASTATAKAKAAEKPAAKKNPPPPPPAPAAKPRSAAPLPVDAPDPALVFFAEGLKALEEKDWAKAAERFGKAIAESDLPDLTARARQYKAAAEKRLPAAIPEPAGEDPYLEAVFEKNRGNLKAALDVARKGGRDKKDERFAYLVAAIHALENRPEEAVQALTQAVELNPKNRIHAFHDTDFAELRKNRDHRHLFGLT